MGFFSWLTSDTQRSIANNSSKRKTFPVHVITEDGLLLTEKDYEGYGEFDGVDIYTLIGEMNGIKGKTPEEIRDKAFSDLFLRGVTNGNDKIYTYGRDFECYMSPIPEEGGLCANELVEKGWEHFGDNMDFASFAKRGLKIPKIVENLPKEFHLFTQDEIKEYFDSLPYPKSCPDQGYFYK